MEPLDETAVDRYLERIDLQPAEIRAADRDVETLARIQTAHVRNVPFENLAIVGDPFDDAPGEGVALDVDHIYDKIVARERGGYCFELNGLFAPLLAALGFDVDRAAAMVLDDDGEASPPANHHTVVVSLDRPYVTDPGLGKPQMTRPTPLDGKPTAEDPAGVAWRVVESDRPDCEYLVQCRSSEHGWEPRYVFDPTPRALSYFEATCDYLAAAPESWWTDNVIVRRKTDSGYVELFEDTFARGERGERTEREVSPDEWYDLLEREFGLSVPG